MNEPKTIETTKDAKPVKPEPSSEFALLGPGWRKFMEDFQKKDRRQEYKTYAQEVLQGLTNKNLRICEVRCVLNNALELLLRTKFDSRSFPDH